MSLEGKGRWNEGALERHTGLYVVRYLGKTLGKKSTAIRQSALITTAAIRDPGFHCYRNTAERFLSKQLITYNYYEVGYAMKDLQNVH